MTKTMEVIDLLDECRLCISCSDLFLLYDPLTLENVEASETCVAGIVADKPPTVIVDNADFKFDTLTGNALGYYQTNVLYVQPAQYEEKRHYTEEAFQHTNKKEIIN